MPLLIYMAQASLYAAIMWGIYFLVWRNRPLHSYSRIYLLSSLALPCMLPLIHLPAHEGTPMSSYQFALPEIAIASTSAQVYPPVFSWAQAIVLVYILGAMLFAVLYLRAYVNINEKLRGGKSGSAIGYTLITHAGIGPGTIGRRIFFPTGRVDDVILRHELAHIRAGHRYDALFVQLMHILFWVSPAHWHIGRELKTVHEFEADRIAGEGIDARAYASVLLSQSFGTQQSFTVAHSFFCHPLKRRIMMLQRLKVPASRALLLVASIALTAGFVSTALLAQTRKPGRVQSSAKRAPAADPYVETWKRILPKPGEVGTLENGMIVFKTVDEMPRFGGNMYDWIARHLHYPESARSKGAEGGSIIQFMVSGEGKILRPKLLKSSGYQMLDDEALRVIGEMPEWKPGKQKGRPVDVLFTLPIHFSLDGVSGC